MIRTMFGSAARRWASASVALASMSNPTTLRKCIRDQFPRHRQTAHGDDDVLLSVEHIGHRITGLRARHVYGPEFLTGGFVVGAQHRAARSRRRGVGAAFARDHERLGDERADAAGATARAAGASGARNIHA